MGKQLCFYLTKEEENDFIKEIIGLGYKIASFKNLGGNLSSELRVYDRFEENLNKEARVFVLMGDSVNENFYLTPVSFMNSGNVIEFCRTNVHKKENSLGHGRIYLNTWYTKDESLHKLYNKLTLIIKKKLIKFTDDDGLKHYVSAIIAEKVKIGEITKLTF